MMMLSVEQLKKKLDAFSDANPQHFIAYSGGLDSHVLLHLCSKLSKIDPTIRFRAIHVHHGLQEAADGWASHCESVCFGLHIPFSLIYVDAKPGKGEGLEASARNARYSALKNIINAGDIVLTAHHHDDQAETVLLQLFRGCGIRGLAAMPESRAFASGQLIRPLLGCARSSLKQYAEEQDLQWIEDTSNQDQSYDRNYIRHAILPLLEQRWHGISGRLKRTSSHCGEALELLGEYSDGLLFSSLNKDKQILSVKKLIELSPAQQRLVLRKWIDDQGARLPSTVVLSQIEREVLLASADAMPSVDWSDYSVKRYRDALYLLPRQQTAKCRTGPLAWDGQQQLELPDKTGRLEAIKTVSIGISSALWRRGKITLCFRQGGERLQPIGRRGNHTLKKLFQEKGIPPWVRNRIPLIYIDGVLAVVVGLWIAEWCKGNGVGDDISVVFDESTLY